PQVRARVKEIDNLNRAWEVPVGEIPDPFGAVAENDFLLCAAPALLPRFQVEPLAELLGRFNRTDVGGRSRVADGVACGVAFGLGEHAAQFGLSGVSRLAYDFTLPARRLLFHHGHSRAIHFHIEHRNRLANYDGEIQLHGPADLLLLNCGDIGSHWLP